LRIRSRTCLVVLVNATTSSTYSSRRSDPILTTTGLRLGGGSRHLLHGRDDAIEPQPNRLECQAPTSGLLDHSFGRRAMTSAKYVDLKYA
jgi:hypothetical protein